MKTRFPFLLILLCLFLFPDASFSGTWTDSNSNNTFSFTGTTVSTSSYFSGRGTPFYQVTGSADISGSADPLGDNTVYTTTLWLSASGDITTSPFPGKDNIDTEKISDGVYSDSHTSGAATILYKSHPVGSLAKNEIDFTQQQATKSLSDSTSGSYADTDYTSPSGLSACPEVHGSLSGTLMNYVGSKSVNSLSFTSDSNCASGGARDDGGGSVANEICHRKQNCKLPGTATSTYSHRVKCPEKMWVEHDGLSFTASVFGQRVDFQKPCTGFWWTCDDDPNDPNTTNVCIWKPKHVKPGERSWRLRYVDPSTGAVSQYPPSQASKHPCGDHNTSVSGDHSLQASCSSSNANGTCTVTSFYACDNHTHSYPSPPPPPPPPSLCPANGWTYCGNTSSDATTCGGGHTYYTCNPSAVAYHGDSKSCRRGGCSNTWSNCQSAPLCDAWQGNKCWAE